MKGSFLGIPLWVIFMAVIFLLLMNRAEQKTIATPTQDIKVDPLKIRGSLEYPVPKEFL